MENQFFYTTVAGLALSLAGFAGVIAFLQGGPNNLDRVNLWRVKAIVGDGVKLMIACLVLIPIFALTSSMQATIRIGAGIVAALTALDLWSERKPDSAVWTGTSWKVFMTSGVVELALALVNLFLANRGLLEIGLLIRLFNPAGIFFNYIQEIRPDSTIENGSGVVRPSEIEREAEV